MRSEVDVSKWSGEGTFTQLLIDCLRSMDAIEFVRVEDRKSTRLNSSHSQISYAVFCLKKKKKNNREVRSYCGVLLMQTAPTIARESHCLVRTLTCTLRNPFGRRCQVAAVSSATATARE